MADGTLLSINWCKNNPTNIKDYGMDVIIIILELLIFMNQDNLNNQI